ncbi:MAG: cytochrome c, partial [Gemmatimonadaceae bacterium]
MKLWMKWAGYAAGGVVGLAIIVAAGVYGVSESHYRKQYSLDEKAVVVPTDSVAIARGAHLANSFAGCADCHGENLAGKAIFDNPALGSVYSLNLTRGKGGVGGQLSDADFGRAIRHGIAPNGRALKIMPSSDYMNLSDEDLGDVIAYIKSRPPVDHEIPAARIGPVGRALYVAGKLPFLHAERIDHARLHVASVTPAKSGAYGEYLASIGCKGCHGPSL